MRKDMESSPQNEIFCHVTCGFKKVIITTTNATILQDISKTFDIERDKIHLQVFNSDWNDWVDVSPADVTNRSRLNVLLPKVQQCDINVLPHKKPKKPEPERKENPAMPSMNGARATGVEIVDTQLSSIPGTSHDYPGISSIPGLSRGHLRNSSTPLTLDKKIIEFCNIDHPLFVKLERKETLDSKEINELVRKVFLAVAEQAFCPTSRDLLFHVRKLLTDFPILQGGNYMKAKDHWMNILNCNFAQLRNELLEKEQNPQVDKSMQTGMKEQSPQVDKSMQTAMKEQSPQVDKSMQTGFGNKPWQVWHRGHQVIPDPLNAFQDMSSVIFSIKKEYEKEQPNREKIAFLMTATYPYRRCFIINALPKVMMVLELYPALFNCKEVRKEFLRITGKGNDRMFGNNFITYSQIIYELTKGCCIRGMIDLSIEAARKSNTAYDWYTAAVLLLPFLLNEDLSFIWFSNEEFQADQTEPYIKCDATLEEVINGGGLFQVYVEQILLAETNKLIIAVECFLASFFIFLIQYRADTLKTLQLLQSFFFEFDDPSEEQVLPCVVKAAGLLKSRLQQSLARA